MKVPFDVNDARLRVAFLRTVLLDALVPLTDGAKALWGRMTAQQMVEHLLWAFEVSTGRAPVECPVPESRLEQMKAFLYNNRPTPRGFENPALEAGLPPLRYDNVPEARMALAAEVKRFLQESDRSPGVIRTHPVFGPIGFEEWSRAHFKHCYHHLLQFGLVDAEPVLTPMSDCIE